MEELVKNCRDCFHVTTNDLGYFCLRYHVYVFPDKGQGKNCSAYVEMEEGKTRAQILAEKMLLV
jgi:hypothetical protein